MVSLRDGPRKFIKTVGAKLKNFFSQFTSEKAAEAARQRFAKAIFGSIYTEDQFEQALDEHRNKMLELGEAINDVLDEFRRHWNRGTERGFHQGYGDRAVAKAYLKRVLSLEERIDAHLEQFERKLAVLSSWRQYKIEEDIGAEVDVEELEEWIAQEYDRHEIEQSSFAEQETENILQTIRADNGGQVVTDEEQDLFNEFIEKEFGTVDESETETQSSGTAFEIEENIDGGGSGNGNNDGDVDEELREFVEEELN